MCGRNHMVSHTSEAVSTQNAQAPSTPQQLLLMQSRDAVQNRTTQQQQSPPTGGSAVAQARRGFSRICCCCCTWCWWWWHMGRSRLRCSTKLCEVGPCSQCATSTSWKESVRSWKRVRGQCLMAWCLRCMAVGQCPATHKWGRRCIEDAPPPEVQRGLLVTAAVAAAACSNPGGGGGAEWHAHTRMHACQQAQPVLHPRVVCSEASHSSALQVQETGPLVAGREQHK